MAPRTKTKPGTLNFNDLGYSELNRAVPANVHSISTEETAENNEPETKKGKSLPSLYQSKRRKEKTEMDTSWFFKLARSIPI